MSAHARTLAYVQSHLQPAIFVEPRISVTELERANAGGKPDCFVQ